MLDSLALKESAYRMRVEAMRQAGIQIPERELELWFEWTRYLSGRLPAIARPERAQSDHPDLFTGIFRDFVHDHPMLPIVQGRLMNAEMLFEVIVNLPRAAILN